MIPSILPTYARAPLTFVQGQGSWLQEADGRRFLDLGAGIAVNVLGHAAPELVSVLTDQAQNLWHTSNLYNIPAQQKLADLLVKHTFADTAFFTNSGTECCELAVKMARKFHVENGQPERTTIITFEGSFHGRSSAGIAAAGSEKMTKGFGPLLPGFLHLPWGDHEALTQAAAQADVGAILVEPVQGEGGIRPLPDQCLKGLRDLCDQHGLLLILDEVQCGVGRTGKLFAHEWSGIWPDIMMVAKGMGGGFPLGAVVATENAAKGMTAGTHGSTYGGNPLCCAAAQAVLDTLVEEPVMQQASVIREALISALHAHVADPSLVSEVRGRGLMIGIQPTTATDQIVAQGLKKGLLLNIAGGDTIRVLPPLVMTTEQAGELGAGIADILNNIAQQENRA